MMKTKLLAWAQAKEIVGFSELTVEINPSESAFDLIERVSSKADELDFCRVAVNQKIQDWDAPLGEAIEIAIIPPVSGG